MRGFCRVFKMHAAMKVAPVRAMNLYKEEERYVCFQVCANPGPFRINFICLWLLSMKCAFLTPFWLIEVRGCSYIFEKFAHPWLHSSLTSAGSVGDWSASRRGRFSPLKELWWPLDRISFYRRVVVLSFDTVFAEIQFISFIFAVSLDCTSVH